MPTRCRRLSADAGHEVFGRGSGRVAAHQLQPEAGDPLVVALERHVALEHRSAQLAILLAGLDLEGGARIALKVARLWDLAKVQASMFLPSGTYQSGIRCGRPFGPTVAQVTVRSWARKRSSSSSDIRI